MALPPLILIVCSDHPSIGKTMLARILVDHLLLDSRDPFVFDTDAPAGALRAWFPGRTALVDASHPDNRARLLGRILASPGRDYVIDLMARDARGLCQEIEQTRFTTAARRAGFRLVVLFLAGRKPTTCPGTGEIAAAIGPDLLVMAHNAAFAAAPAIPRQGPTIELPVLADDLAAMISSRRFSLRAFVAGEDQGIAPARRAGLMAFLHPVLAGLGEIGPAISLLNLRR